MNTFETKVTNLVQDLITGSNAVSVQYALMHNGEFILSQGVGFYQKENSIAASNNHLYGIGSVSKIYAVASVIRLCEEGLIDIDKPLCNYLREFKMADKRYTLITPRMLMNHSSGIYGTHFSDAFLFDNPCTKTHDQLLSKLSKETLKYAPGTMSEYCNDGFTLLEILTEKITGMDYSKYLEEKIFSPLNITKTVSPLSQFDKKDLAKAYFPNSDITLPTETLGVIGAGGLYSNAEDLCKFGRIFVYDNKNPILSTKSAKAMAEPEYKKGIWPQSPHNNVFGFGLGWDKVQTWDFGDQKIDIVFKGGDSMLYHSALIVLPTLDIVMAVSSSGGMSVANFVFSINVLSEYLYQKGILNQKSLTKKDLTYNKQTLPPKFKKYQGLYANTISCQHLEFEDNKFNLSNLFGGMIPPQTYFYVGDDKFLGEDNTTLVSFVTASNDNTYLQISATLTLANIGQLTWTTFDSQKLLPFDLSFSVKSHWENRKGKTYYLVSEGTSAQLYFVPSMLLSIKLNDDFDSGYAYGGCKIIDENTATNCLSFRDVTDLNFFRHEGKEYLKARDLVYISQDDINDLSHDNHQTYTISDVAYGSYYKVTKELSGKTVTLSYDQNSAFALYDENLNCQIYSTIDNKTVITLPKSGKILFLGNAGAKFTLSYLEEK